MIIVSIKNITTLTDMAKRLDGKKPDVILIETKKDFSHYCILLSGKKFNKKSFYNFSFRGIPIILPWQIRL